MAPILITILYIIIAIIAFGILMSVALWAVSKFWPELPIARTIVIGIFAILFLLLVIYMIMGYPHPFGYGRV